ncbi:MAG: hypothetical protein N4A44_03710 [Alphaproteobacteria bacterium]|jgi:hypothetical protein|nr:hypothetical protein [Alphaproteobacteria bacterium]
MNVTELKSRLFIGMDGNLYFLRKNNNIATIWENEEDPDGEFGLSIRKFVDTIGVKSFRNDEIFVIDVPLGLDCDTVPHFKTLVYKFFMGGHAIMKLKDFENTRVSFLSDNHLIQEGNDEKFDGVYASICEYASNFSIKELFRIKDFSITELSVHPEDLSKKGGQRFYFTSDLIEVLNGETDYSPAFILDEDGYPTEIFSDEFAERIVVMQDV